ncbi:MAG: hypothetical protein GF384_01325 [Elusimicrobia bacterium]|nr:hypothetical protein [Elusimicrobiota bacterium]
MNKQIRLNLLLILIVIFYFQLIPTNALSARKENQMNEYIIQVQFEDPFVDDISIARKIIIENYRDNKVLPTIKIRIDGNVVFDGRLKYSGSLRTHYYFGRFNFKIKSSDPGFSITLEADVLDEVGDEIYFEFENGKFLYVYYDIVRRTYRIEQLKEPPAYD